MVPMVLSRLNSVPRMAASLFVIQCRTSNSIILRRRPGPEVIVDSRRNGFGGFSSNRVPPLETQSPRQIDVAKRAFVKVVDRLDLRAARSALRAVLHDPVVFLSGTHELASFPQVV